MIICNITMTSYTEAFVVKILTGAQNGDDQVQFDDAWGL